MHPERDSTAYRHLLLPVGLLLLVAVLMRLVPLSNAISIGGDDGFELSKSLLLARAPELAPQMWNDQPWLHTALVAFFFRSVVQSAAVPRVISLLSAVAMLLAIERMLRKDCQVLESLAVAVFFVTGSGVPTMMCSAMTELVGLSTAVVATSCLTKQVSNWRLILSGVLFACACQIKLTALVVLPATLVYFLLHSRQRFLRDLFVWLSVCSVSFAAIAALSPTFNAVHLLGTHGLSSRALWSGAFAGYSFTPGVLVNDPPVCVAALLGIGAVCKSRYPPAGVFAIAFLATSTFVALLLRPWWEYYMLHFQIPLSILAGYGAAFTIRALMVSLVQLGPAPISENAGRRARVGVGLAFSIAAILALWASYSLPRVFSELRLLSFAHTASRSTIVQLMKRYSAETRWCYVPNGYYAFHADLLVPPELVVVSAKRFLSKQMTDATLMELLMEYSPDQIVLGENETHEESELLHWIRSNYLLVLTERGDELWIHAALNPKVEVDRRIMEFGL